MIIIYVVAAVAIGVAIWFFVQKANDVDTSDGLAEVTPTVTPTVTPVATPVEFTDNGEWVKLDNGLQVQDVTIGDGQEAVNDDLIAAHYIGTLEDGTKFDSSYDRGEPIAIVLGKGMVIQGWDIGLVGMKVGGKRKLIIPSDLAYGDAGAGDGAIPGGATLYFDIELVAVQTPPLADDTTSGGGGL